jgi:hypothetical protein
MLGRAPNCAYEHAEQNFIQASIRPAEPKGRRKMQIVHEQSGGLDVHKKSVVACRMRVGRRGKKERETHTFGTTTPALLALAEWLRAWEIEDVAMESTGEYWKPIYNILEGQFNVILVNAQHVKQVPGRKTDVRDAAPTGHPLAELQM